MFNILKNDYFVDFEKYPQLKRAFTSILSKMQTVDFLSLAKLMHLLTAYTLEFPYFIEYVKELDKAL